jgi:hypothetical protein
MRKETGPDPVLQEALGGREKDGHEATYIDDEYWRNIREYDLSMLTAYAKHLLVWRR